MDTPTPTGREVPPLLALRGLSPGPSGETKECGTLHRQGSRFEDDGGR
jgi:hypothetical protein